CAFSTSSTMFRRPRTALAPFAVKSRSRGAVWNNAPSVAPRTAATPIPTPPQKLVGVTHTPRMTSSTAITHPTQTLGPKHELRLRETQNRATAWLLPADHGQSLAADGLGP